MRIFLRFDAINQIVFDDVEPRSVLISCRDDRRFVYFQNLKLLLTDKRSLGAPAGVWLDCTVWLA